MEIIGLEQNYYLAGNDIYIKVRGTSEPSVYMDVEVMNVTTGQTLGSLRPYPNLDNEYKFNICLPVRALFPEPDNMNAPNSIQRISVSFKATLNDGTTETSTISKLFVRGGRNKNGAQTWNLNDGDLLTSAPFPRFVGVKELPNGIHRIEGEKVVEYVPKERFDIYRRSVCNPTWVRFLNSLGGYEWWCFEQRHDENEGKAGKTKSLPTTALKQDAMRQLSTSQSREFTLSSEMPIEFYDLAVEMCNSVDLYIYNPEAPDDDMSARYERVFLNGTNKVEKNTMSKKIKFDLKLFVPSYVTREI